jgi:hypothetical protein
MQIEVKDFHRLSNERKVIAKLYVNGTMAADLEILLVNPFLLKHNYFPYGKSGHILVGMAEQHLRGQAPQKASPLLDQTNPYASLISFVEAEFFKHIKEQKEPKKELTKMEKEMVNHVLYGTEEQYKKFRVPGKIEAALSDPITRSLLMQLIQQQVFPDMKKGAQILNTNFPPDFLKELFKGSKQQSGPDRQRKRDDEDPPQNTQQKGRRK